jgi:hypothetical protein
VSSVLRPNLAPEALFKDLTSLDLRSFLARHGDELLLLVRIPQGDTDLELGLDTEAGPASVAKPLPFRTSHQTPPGGSSRSLGARREERIHLADLLAKHAYVAVPLRKREGGDAAFMDRISVGRAQNKDIVLRHQSISKFHAWFEVDSDAVHLSDSGSTNKTQVNGHPIEPRTRVPVASGDLVQFGAIEAVLCSPELLWWCFNPRDEEH